MSVQAHSNCHKINALLALQSTKEERMELLMMKEMNEHRANMEVAGRKVVRIVAVVVHKGLVVVGRIDLAAVVNKVVAVVLVVAARKVVELEVGRIEVVADLGRMTEDMEKTFGLGVEEEVVCYILFALEDMVKMSRMVAG
jgi:hypothetical protein